MSAGALSESMVETLRRLDVGAPEWFRAVGSNSSLDGRRVLTNVARALLRRGDVERRRILNAWWYTITTAGRDALERIEL